MMVCCLMSIRANSNILTPFQSYRKTIFKTLFFFLSTYLFFSLFFLSSLFSLILFLFPSFLFCPISLSSSFFFSFFFLFFFVSIFFPLSHLLEYVNFLSFSFPLIWWLFESVLKPGQTDGEWPISFDWIPHPSET